MKVLTNDNIPVGLWEDFLKYNKHSSPFQSHGFYRLFNSVRGFSAIAVAISEGEVLKALVVVTIQQEKGLADLFSRRAIIYGGPMVEDECPHALDILLKEVDHITGGRVIYTETRNLSDFSGLTGVFETNGYSYVPWLNFMVDTSDHASMVKRVSSSRLRQIKKARQKSVICKEAVSLEEVLSFYGILKGLYEKKLHKPLPPEEFFVRFHEAGIGKIILVWTDNKIIGGIMCPVLAGRVIYEFYVCGLDDEYDGFYPSVMATWSAMEYASEAGIPVFDFMGAGKPDEGYGVRDFKARFGGELVTYGRFIKINRPLKYKIGTTALKLMKHLG